MMTLREKISLFPHSPGVYRYYDASGNIIYVGKAKDLHKRVAQYFVPAERLTRKTAIMVGKIADAQYSVVDSEADALLLENNLIKQYKPRYNILLKDSKTYPWICISREAFPRIYLTRRPSQKEGECYGPYSNVIHARVLLELFAGLYPLRSCRYKLSSDVILHGKIRPCLDFHIGKCKAPCAGRISMQEYDADIADIRSLLKGDTAHIIAKYRALMTRAAENLDFETAQRYKMMMDRLGDHYAKSVVSGAAGRNCDVFTLEFDDDRAYGNFLRVHQGCIIQSLNLAFRLGIEEPRESVLSTFIEEIRSKFGELSKELILPYKPDIEFEGITFTLPSRGDKLSLLELSAKNAREMRFNALKQEEHTDPDEFYNKILAQLRDALGMSVLPEHIECFDNSNIQGTNPVGACVVFRGGKPSKKDYRIFNIKTVVGANDYATMKEVLNRRYSRMLAEAPDDLPQLIVIDGGRGQLSSAWEALTELGLEQRLTVVALAERMEEVIRVDDPYPMLLDRNSQALKLLQRLRDEAHRFGITRHRARRSKAQIDSALRHIKGVGPKMEERLLLHFGSLRRIGEAPVEEIASITGNVLAQTIKNSITRG